MKLNLNTFIKQVKSVKIQGATNIALKSSEFFVNYINKKYQDLDNKDYIYEEIIHLYNTLINIRPTEPLLKNSLSYLLKEFFELKNNYRLNQKPNKLINNTSEYIISKINQNYLYVKNYFINSLEKISKIGSKKIFNGSTIYTHCHSSNVIAVLKEAKRNYKNFIVHNTETRPLYQGRKTALELAKSKISVFHYLDSEARIAIKNSDFVFLGCDSITSELNFVNKIGSEMIALIADYYDIPVYIITLGWKYNSLTKEGFKQIIENRSPKEVWNINNKYINIINYAFEFIDKKLITAVISELGIFTPDVFLEELFVSYPWLR